MKIVLGTKNPGKLKELFDLSGKLTWLSLALAPSSFAPLETGSTFAENALIKAQEAAHLTHELSIGEDSGIVVPALGGKPGIYSARYCEGNDCDRMLFLLHEMQEIPAAQRSAYYVSAMSLVSATGEVLKSAQGEWHGEIAQEPIGTDGFGYDPIFWLPSLQKTAAQISLAEKNALSHRGQAWRELLNYLKDLA